ncbi:hypothetical protein, partial [Sphaerisporangium rhizosphaerae]
TKGTIPATTKATEDGKMHNHALAFNTLLSSQETDAYTTGNQTLQGPDPRLGRSFRMPSF